MATAGVATLAAVTLTIILSSSLAAAHNITAILEPFPEYSLYNSYLTKTKVSDEINDRSTITALVLDNTAMAALASDRPLAAIKNALRLLNLLDYFDAPKLHDISQGSILTSTLLQATGDAPSNLGFVNITDLRGGKVGFASAAVGSKFEATFTKSIRQVPYNLSVLQVSAPIVFRGLFDVETVSTASNLTSLLIKEGCKTFASLLESSGVIKIFEDSMKSGLTILAPSDEAFKSDAVPDLTTLSSAELVALLQYHALPSYTPKITLKTDANENVSTLASSVAGKYDLSVVVNGDDVALKTGIGSSRVANTILDDAPVCVMVMDDVLLPVELFGLPPAPAPAPESVTPAPAPVVEAPSPAPKKGKGKGKLPKHKSPPAPPIGTAPVSSPSDAPEAAADKAQVKSTAVMKIPAMAGALSMIFVMFLVML